MVEMQSQKSKKLGYVSRFIFAKRSGFKILIALIALHLQFQAIHIITFRIGINVTFEKVLASPISCLIRDRIHQVSLTCLLQKLWFLL